MGTAKTFLFSVSLAVFILPKQLLLAAPLEDKYGKIEQLMAMSLEELIEVRVSVATGTPISIKQAPSVASVITAEDIRKMGARTINEALETVPGLHVGVSTKNAMSQVYSMRGIHTSVNPQVLLMINGIPISNVYTGTRAFFNMPVSGIARIEIIRGPGSAVYGADAFSGTINIITKNTGDLNGTETGARSGSFDTYDIFAQHGGTYKGWDVFAGLEYQTSRGDASRIIDSDLQTVLDGALGTNSSLAPGSLDTSYGNLDMHMHLSRDNWTMRLWGEVQDGDFKDGVTNVLSRGSDLDIVQYLADINYENKNIVKDLTLTGRLYFMYYEQEALVPLFPDGAVLPIGKDGNIDFAAPAGVTFFPNGVWGQPVQIDKQTGFDLNGIYSGTTDHRIRSDIGYKYLREEAKEYKNFGPGILDGSQSVQDGTLTDVTGTEYIYLPDNTREVIYISLQDEWSLSENWELVAGLRYDHYSDFGDTFNPRAALVWDIMDNLTTKLLYGRAFRPPSFNELYVQNNPSNNGNPDLDPETIQTYEFVADYQPLDNFHLRMNLFYYDIEDLIELVQDPGQTTLTSQNNKNQKGQGFELEAQLLAAENLLLKGNLAFQDSEDKESGEPVPDAPQWQAYFNAHWTFQPDWSLDAQYHWIGKRKRASGDIREDIKDNHIVNLTIRRTQILENWEFALAVRNLFGENVREPSPSAIMNDYPMEERSFWAELRFQL